MNTCMRMYVSVVFFVPGGRGYACGCVHAYVCECSVGCVHACVCVSVVFFVPDGRGYACGCVHAYVCECGVFCSRRQGIRLWVRAFVCM